MELSLFIYFIFMNDIFFFFLIYRWYYKTILLINKIITNFKKEINTSSFWNLEHK